MSQSRTKIVRRLASALDSRAPVTVRRKRLDKDTVHGFVIALTDSWVVLHERDGIYLEKVVILRLDLVTKVERLRGKEKAYILRGVQALGVPLERFPCAAHATVGDLLSAVDQRADLVGAHVESPKEDWINFGKIRRIGAKRLDLQFVGRDGDWLDYAHSWRLEDITRIEFGGRYLRALERFSDPRPPVTSLRKC